MPEPLKQHIGVTAAIMRDNIDTDQIIPSREMKTVSRDGLGQGLFAGWRYLEPGGRTLNPDFVLNCGAQKTASVLISGENFGCGSSREHAVWALQEFGFRVIIAKSFGEIFHGNCIRNGVLPITLEAETVTKLASPDSPPELTIDLEQQLIISGDQTPPPIAFEIGEFAKRLLVEGLDPIALTMTDEAKIEDFFERDAQRRPWVYSAA
ncbi:MAG: 3-isopropylmalate dehydratase small subunit [Henriciella sp.]